MDRMHGRFDTMDTPSSLFRSVPSPLFSTLYLVDLVCNPSAVVGTWVWLPTERQRSANWRLVFAEQVDQVGGPGDGGKKS